jgi:DNA-binding NarL/FixJ family response regulator
LTLIKVAVYEDNKHLRESLQLLIDNSPGFRCIGAFPDCTDIIFNTHRERPDVVLMDIEMPGMNGIEALKLLRNQYPDLQVLMQTMFDDDDYVFKAICAGASGYILKSTTSTGYLDAITDVYNGGSPMTGVVARKVLSLFQKHVEPSQPSNYHLTVKEKEVLRCMVQGRSFKMIAADLSISYETVRTHMKNIYTKLHVNSNTEAVAKVLKERIV